MCLIYVIQKANMDSVFHFRSAKSLYELYHAFSMMSFIITLILTITVTITITITCIANAYALAYANASHKYIDVNAIKRISTKRA